MTISTKVSLLYFYAEHKHTHTHTHTHTHNRMSCKISRSKLTKSMPLRGCRMMRVACNPDLAASMDLHHACCHSVSYSISARATLLYVRMIFLASFVVVMFLLFLNFFIGISILRRSWRDHRMLPATGDALRIVGGAWQKFSKVSARAYFLCKVNKVTAFEDVCRLLLVVDLLHGLEVQTIVVEDDGVL